MVNHHLGCIFLMLFSDFRAPYPISIPTPPIMTLTDCFHPLSVSWYLISLLWMYLCSCMHIMSMLWSIAIAVSSGSWPIQFQVLTLNVTICTLRLYFSNFCFTLSSGADFSNTGARAPTSAGRPPLFSHRVKTMWYGRVVSVWVTVFHGFVFFIIYWSHPYTWAAVIPRSKYLILVVVLYVRPGLC